MKRKSNKKAWEALKQPMSNYLIQAGWFETAKYDNGIPIGGIAAVQNYGATINHPGGTPYLVLDKTGLVQFVTKENGADLPKTKPHTIVIPPTHFYEHCLEKNKEKWKNLIAKNWKAVFAGLLSPQGATESLGSTMENDLRREMTDGDYPPVRRNTLRQKLSKYKKQKDVGDLAKRFQTKDHKMIDNIAHKIQEI